ncbi:MAG: thiamine pyrophosphate-dependent enzyme [Clostridiales bacterium]|nr:thiamine pyrophosphate-dependent enzyme [Clostridiales bacterium]
MKAVYERPKVFTDAITTYCGGCGHGIVNKLIAELIDEMGLQKNGVIAWPIGCSCLADKFYNMDQIMCLHGRAPATATGMKRAEPDKFVLVYQGDGDMVSEGMAEIMHAAIRGEKFSVVFINNAIYGMTGGQIAPTTLMGQKATTAPAGRSAINSGYPINMAETLASLKGVCYSERVTVTSPAAVAKTKRAMKKAFELQMQGKGMTFVEILSPCPTNWSMSPVKCLKWIDDVMVEQYPLGVFKDVEEEA